MERSRSPKMPVRNTQSGLTLVEVLVALAILGLVVASIMALIGQNTRFLSTAEERMVASILADNEMTELLARPEKLEFGDMARHTEFGGRAWIVEHHVFDTGIQGLVRIEIDVREKVRGQVAASATTLKAERL